MPGKTPTTAGEPTVRPLAAADLDAVIAIDKANVGRSRRSYFQKRLEAARRHPDDHVQLGIEDKAGFAGYVLARFREGEFGSPEPILVLEAIGITPGHQHAGLGHELIAGLEAAMRGRKVRILQTQSAWNEHDMLRFLDACGFALAPRQVVECAVAEGGR